MKIKTKPKRVLYSLFAHPVLETKKAYSPAGKEKDYLYNYVRPADIHVRRDILPPEVYKAPLKKGAVHNFISKDSYVLDNPILKNMKAKFQEIVDHYCYDLFKFKREHKFYITQSWMNFNPKGTGHHVHHHPNSIMSSVYFLEVPEKCPPITFHSDAGKFLFPQFAFNHVEWNEFNSTSWWIKAVKGSLLLFPSCLRHSVTPNPSKTPRVSMSFNVFAKLLGEPTNLDELKLDWSEEPPNDNPYA